MKNFLQIAFLALFFAITMFTLVAGAAHFAAQARPGIEAWAREAVDRGMF